MAKSSVTRQRKAPGDGRVPAGDVSVLTMEGVDQPHGVGRFCP